jgi:hypothetical protein
LYPQGQPQSYRLGDFARPGFDVGDYVVRVTGIEPAATKDGSPQLKFSSVGVGGPNHGKTHQWYYPLKTELLFILFNDLLAVGLPKDFDPGPPDPQRYAAGFAAMLANQAFKITVSQSGEFKNTKMTGRAELGPDGMPIGAAPPQPSFPPMSGQEQYPPQAAPAPGFGVAPQPGFGAAPATGFPPTHQPTPQPAFDPASLFRRA